MFEVDPETGRKIKKVCRYQQFRAVNKAVQRVAVGEHRKGLIWHTQGSGKSLTMVFLALKLKAHLTLDAPTLANPNILVLTDRIDLDEGVLHRIGEFEQEEENKRRGAVLLSSELLDILRPIAEDDIRGGCIWVVHDSRGNRLPTLDVDVWRGILLDACVEYRVYHATKDTAVQIARVQKAGIPVCGTATTVEEAKVLAAAGVNAIAAQGEEAGAHRGTFLRSAEESMVPTYELVRGVVAATGLPVFASGGLMDGADITRAFEAGAQAAQLGTAFLLCPESGVPEPYREALRARKDTTVITRVFSGRAARGLRNRFIDDCEGVPVLPFRQQNDLTRAMRTESGKKGLPDYISLWAGRGVTRIREMPAPDLVRALVVEIGGR